MKISTPENSKMFIKFNDGSEVEVITRKEAMQSYDLDRRDMHYHGVQKNRFTVIKRFNSNFIDVKSLRKFLKNYYNQEVS
jgi:hypothetical protein